MRRRDVICAGGALVAVGATAGCSDGSSPETTTAEPPLALETIEFADGEPSGYIQYEPLPSATYELGDTVWLYAEPVGVTVDPLDGGDYTFEIEISLSVTVPDGRTEDVGSPTYSQDIGDPEAIEELYVKPSVSISDPADPGTYEAEVTVRDELDGETVSEVRSFEIESA